jgi:hypothetical protein
MNDSHTKPVLLDTPSFRLPCRSFYVRANVTRDRALPVVDEFVLRLLRICGELTLQRLADFFGFTRGEAEQVANHLASTDMLVVEGDSLRLSGAAAELFKASADEEPRLISVEAWTENVWIDLVSRSLVPRPRQRPHRNLVEVNPVKAAVELPADFARVAFEDNFRDYVTRIRRLREPDRVSIHSIASVEPDRHGAIAVPSRRVFSIGDNTSRLEFDGLSRISDSIANSSKP